MTEDQIKEEVRFIETFQLWPRWPVLPVKRLGRTGDDGVGIVIATFDEVVTDVILMNMWDLASGPLLEQVKDKPRIGYDSVEEMVRDGWVGD